MVGSPCECSCAVPAVDSAQSLFRRSYNNILLAIVTIYFQLLNLLALVWFNTRMEFHVLGETRLSRIDISAHIADVCAQLVARLSAHLLLKVSTFGLFLWYATGFLPDRSHFSGLA